MLRAAEFVKSQKNHELLHIDGYLFMKNNVRKDATYWKCTQTKEMHCSGIVKTVSTDNGIFITSDICKIKHNHMPIPNRVDNLKVIDKIKSTAETSMDCPVQIIQSSLESVPSTSAPYLPNKNALRQVINRVRRQNITSTLLLNELPDWACRVDDEQF